MEITLIEIGLKQIFARKNCKYIDQIDKLTTCSFVNNEHKRSTTEKAQNLQKTWYKMQIGMWNMEVVQK